MKEEYRISKDALRAFVPSKTIAKRQLHDDNKVHKRKERKMLR